VVIVSIYTKISLLNLKKSLKDYAIYIFTLAVISSLFFAFLTIGSANSPFRQSINEEFFNFNELRIILSFGLYASSIAIFFIVVYVNKYILKTRLKSLTLYLILGMKNRTVSYMFFVEGFLLGIVGIVIGIIFGHLLTIAITGFTFVLSGQELQFYFVLYGDISLNVVVFFSIMLFIIGLTNIYRISRYSLADLWNLEKKSEVIKYKKRYLILSSFVSILSAITVVFSLTNLITIGRTMSRLEYSTVQDPDMTFENIMDFTNRYYNIENPLYLQFIAVLGIFIFLYSFFYTMSYILYAIKDKRSKNLYKNNNIVVLNNLLSKSFSNARSFGSITLCLTLTFSVLFTMPSVFTLMEGYLEYRTAIDIQVVRNNFYETSLEDIEVVDFSFINDILEHHNIEVLNSVQVESFFVKDSDFNTEDTRINALDLPVLAIGLSDYNSLRRIMGHSEIVLSENEFVMHLDYEADIDLYFNNFRSGLPITLENGKVLYLSETIAYTEPISPFINNNSLRIETLIFPDTSLNGLSIAATGMYISLVEHPNLELANIILDNITNGYIYFSGLHEHEEEYIRNSLRDLLIRIRSIEQGSITQFILAMRLVFIYMSFIFGIIAFGYISIMQIIDGRERKEEFNTMFKIGMSKKSIYSIIHKQITFFFFVTISSSVLLSFLVYHVVTAVRFRDRVQLYSTESIMYTIIYGTLIFAVIILGYFFMTIKAYKNEINDIFDK